MILDQNSQNKSSSIQKASKFFYSDHELKKKNTLFAVSRP